MTPTRRLTPAELAEAMQAYRIDLHLSQAPERPAPARRWDEALKWAAAACLIGALVAAVAIVEWVV